MVALLKVVLIINVIKIKSIKKFDHKIKKKRLQRHIKNAELEKIAFTKKNIFTF
jgi:hypothetical protein